MGEERWCLVGVGSVSGLGRVGFGIGSVLVGSRVGVGSVGSRVSGVGIGSVSVGGEGVWLRSCVSGINLPLPIHFRVKDSLVERE